MSGEEVILSVRVPKVVDEQLNRIAEETGRTKSQLIREAVIALIGMHRDARKP